MYPFGIFIRNSLFDLKTMSLGKVAKNLSNFLLLLNFNSCILLSSALVTSGAVIIFTSPYSGRLPSNFVVRKVICHAENRLCFPGNFHSYIHFCNCTKILCTLLSLSLSYFLLSPAEFAAGRVFIIKILFCRQLSRGFF